LGREVKKKNNFILQGGILGIAGILTRIIGMIYRIPVTNIITPKGNGYYAAAYQIYTIMLLISSYSLPLAVSKLVSARISSNQTQNAKKVFNGALIFACVTGGIVCLLVFFGAEYFAGRLMSEPLSAIALKIFAPTLLVVAIMGVVRGYFQGMGTMVPTAVSQIIEQIVNAVVSILAAKYLMEYGTRVAALLKDDNLGPAYGAAGSTLGTSLGALSGLIFLLVMLVTVGRQYVKEDKNAPAKNNESYTFVMRLIIITVLPVIMSTAVYNVSELLSNSIFNKVMLQQGHGDEKSFIWGVYSGEYKILLNVPIALANSMCASVVPTLTACMAMKDAKAARRKISQAMRFTMIIAFPCAIGLAVLAKPIMNMLFHQGADSAAAMMHLGFINIILYSISTLSNGILQGINKMNIPVRNAVVSLVVHVIALCLMLTKTNLGINSVIIANFFFAGMMSFLNHRAIRRYLRYKQEIPRTFIVPAICSAIMAIIILLMNGILNIVFAKNVSTIISIILGAVVYGISLLKLGGVSKSEIAAFPMGDKIVNILIDLRIF